ncbi:MAG: hypothetical protein ACI3Y5_05180 [Prevotella sp.]
MNAPMSFSMPMVRGFVPEAIRPWIYLLIALCFQITGARYLGALNEIIGANGQMREDVLMCLYCNLAGMALWFPMLFRMKFRFTNKTLLTGASTVVIITNLLIGYVTWLPLLWLLCLLEGIAKIQGTFECMSNIQLWMTPKRDMTVFFPLLHIVILSGMNSQDYLSAWFGTLGDWRLMHWLIAGIHCIVLLFLLTCVKHFRFMRLPLYGIDWTSMALWAALLMQLAYLLDYGDWYAWFNHDAVWYLTGTTLITLGAILHRMVHVRHPYINPKVFSGFRYVKQIFLLICFVECLFATEHILEEIFLEEVMHYNTIVNASLCLPVWIGNMCGCLFSLFWLQKVMRMSYIRLGIIGASMLLAYLVFMYLCMSPSISKETLYVPLFCRGFAYTTLSVVFMSSLCDVMDFNHFFQGLSIFNMIHMVIGGCVGCAIYSKLLGIYVADGFMRYTSGALWMHSTAAIGSGEMVSEMLLVGVKSIYGWACYGCVFLILGFMLFDSPIRRHHSFMLPWRIVGERLKKYYELKTKNEKGEDEQGQ